MGEFKAAGERKEVMTMVLNATARPQGVVTDGQVEVLGYRTT